MANANDVEQAIGGAATDVVQGVASFFGVDRALEPLIRKVNQLAKKLGWTNSDWITTSSDVIAKISSFIQKLRSENAAEANVIANLINGLPAGKSSTLKMQIADKMKELKAKQRKNAQNEQLINAIDTSATQQAYGIDNLGWSERSKKADQIVENMTDMASKIEKTI